MNFCLVFADACNILLPIKPKPLLYPKDATLMSNSRTNLKTDRIIDAMLVSERIFSLSMYSESNC